MTHSRIATPHDAARLTAITRAAFASSASTPYPSSVLKEPMDEVMKALRDGAVLRFDGERAVAACRFRVTKEALSFSRLCVLPRHQREGHATALVRWLEEHARVRKCARVECSARSAYPDNRPFYVRLGYEIIGYEDVYGVRDLRTRLRLVL